LGPPRTQSQRTGAKNARSARPAQPVPAELGPYVDQGRVPDQAKLLSFLAARLTAPSGSPMLATDRLGRIMLWSEGAAQVYGYSAAAAVGTLTLTDIWSAQQDQPSWQQALEHAVRQPAGWSGEISCRRQDGTAFDALLSMTPVRLRPGGSVIGFLVDGKDVTASNEQETSAAAELQRIHATMAAFPGSWIAVDLTGAIEDLNDQMAVLAGRPAGELIGAPFGDCFAEQDQSRAQDIIAAVLRDGEVADVRLTARGAAAVTCAARATVDASRKPSGFVATFSDLAGIMGQERQLADSRAFNASIVEAADGVIAVNSAGAITYLSEQMCTLIGYSRDEMIGFPLTGIFANAEQARGIIAQTVAQGALRHQVAELTTSSGLERHVSINTGIFQSPGSREPGVFAMARDITDEVTEEKQAAQGQFYNRALIEASVDGLMTVDFQGYISDVNSRLCEMLGTDREKLVGSEFTSCFAHAGGARELVHRALLAGKVIDRELRLANDDETTVSVNSSLFRDPHSDVAGIFISARDISPQVAIREAASAERAYNQALLDSSVEAFFAVSPDGIITDVNGPANKLTGYSRKRLNGRPFSDLFDDPDEVDRGLALAFKAGQLTDFGLTLSTGARPRAMSLNAGVFRDASGQPQGLLVAARDITAQAELEDRLRSQQIYSRSLIEASDALVMTDVTGRITDLNERMAALVDRSRDDLLGTAVGDCFTDPERAMELVVTALREQAVTDYELTAHSPGGGTAVSCNATTFTNNDGQLQGVFAAVRDATEQVKLADMQQKMLDQARKLDETKTEFVSRVSHELRSPLTGVIGYVELLRIGRPGTLNEEQQRMVAIIDRNGRRLLALIEDLLLLSRIEAGSMTMVLEPVALAPLIEEVHEGYLPAIAEAQVNCQLHAEPGIVLDADASQLERVLANLLSNAIKFTQPGGHIDVTTSREDDDVVVVVRDDGIGIPLDEQDRLFTRFFRSSISSKMEARGTGLGLFIVRQVAEGHHGTVTAQSAPGAGTTFTVRLPVHAAAPPTRSLEEATV
jgi:PAS domain S-box-containing protein